MRIFKIFFLLFVFLSTGIAQDWGQLGSDIDGEAAGDQSGFAVSISPNGLRVAIGSKNNGTGAGHVRVFSESAAVWTQVGGDIDGEAAGDHSGASVSLSSDGKRLAIGAPLNAGTAVSAGHVRVYLESGGVWTLMGRDIDGEALGDQSGTSVSLSSDGTRLAIGAPYNSGSGFNTGHVRVYQDIAGLWTLVGGDIDGEAAGDQSGTSVSLSSDGTRLAIGAPLNNTGDGHVRVYSESGGVWTQVGIDIDAEAAGDRFGTSVSLSSNGTRVAIGAPSNGGGAEGHVRVYSESGGVWTQVGGDIDGEAAGNQSGTSVSLSSNGTRVAIGAPYNGGIGGNAGHVRVYSESGGVWTQLGTDIDGEAIGDQSGTSVSLSSDGGRVAIGAPINSDGGGAAGQGRIYFLDPALPVELTSFTIENILEGVMCEWRTESEIENLGFILERKTDGSDWKEITSYKTDNTLLGQGTTSTPTDYEYVDNLVEPVTTYEYRLADIDYNGVVTYHSVRIVTVDKAPLSSKLEKFTVLHAYPNPFNPSTTIIYGLDKDSEVSIQIYDIVGKLVNTLLNTNQTHGWHSVIWNGTSHNGEQVPAGIYLSKITSNNTIKTTKLMLLK